MCPHYISWYGNNSNDSSDSISTNKVRLPLFRSAEIVAAVGTAIAWGDQERDARFPNGRRGVDMLFKLPFSNILHLQNE